MTNTPVYALLLVLLPLVGLGCPEKPTSTDPDSDGGDPAGVDAAPVVVTNPLVLFDLAKVEGEFEAAVLEIDGVEAATYPVGTTDSDVRPMLEAVQQGKRADIQVPEVQGDLMVEVYSLWHEGPGDLDGNGHADKVLQRWAVVPRLGEVTTSAWLMGVMADAEGNIGPDQIKEGVLLDAALAEGHECPLVVSAVAEDGSVTYDKRVAGGVERFVATPRKVSDTEKLASDPERDVALVSSAMQVYDTGVLAPETAYVKAFIVSAYLPEVGAVESTRDLMFPEVLAPLYGHLKLVASKLRNPDVVSAYEAADAQLPVKVAILVHEGDLRLSLSADELRQRVQGLQELGEQFEALEGTLEMDGEKVRRRDFEAKLGQVSDPAERAAVTKTYQDAFRPVVAKGGRYEQFIGEMNEIARAHGHANYADMRMVEKFGLDLEGFMAWADQTWAATDADAQAFVQSLEQFAGAESLTYWQVGQLTDAWVLDQVGMEELPTLSEADAQAVMKQYYADCGLDMGADPYDRITMDWYQDDLKWNRAGTAATATPRFAYFTSNLKPGAPIPIDEWETPMHETAHTLHYQTSGAAAPGLSSYQNNMPSYVAEGVAMTFEDGSLCHPTLMRHYFEGKPGFTDKLFDVYPQVKAQAIAWQTRRLLNMGLYEINLYVDRDAEGHEIPWEDRVGAWDEMVRQRLFVEPPEDAVAQIMCRSHPFNDQSQLGYSSYSLGHALVIQIRKATVVNGEVAELKPFGDAMIRVMAQGALASRKSVQAIVDELAANTTEP